MKTILLKVPDLMFGAQIEQAAKSLGFATRDLKAGDALEAAFKDAGLLVVQLKGPQEAWKRLIGMAKAEGVPVLAFGPHVEAEALRAARAAGADKAVPNSQLVTDLTALLSGLASA